MIKYWLIKKIKKYYCEWKNDTKNGEGIIYYKNGEELEGIWKDDILDNKKVNFEEEKSKEIKHESNIDENSQIRLLNKNENHLLIISSKKNMNMKFGEILKKYLGLVLLLELLLMENHLKMFKKKSMLENIKFKKYIK